MVGTSLAVVVLTAGFALADPAVPVDLCSVSDPGLAELSGFASDGDRWYAINDSDEGSVAVQVLNRSCEVVDTITSPVNPFDVEDLARAPDGTLWLSDTGDNGRTRETIALHEVSPSGGSRFYRLTYPDGAHDAEALLLDRSGTPYVVTKEPIGSALVYRPAGPLVAGTTAPMEKVGSVSLDSTDTPGGPVSGLVGSRVVTGGAVSADGAVAALRTYTDAYLFPVPDGDLVTALKSDPVRVPLPDEPQGEAVAFEPDGTLLSGSESRNGVPGVVRAVEGAAALAASPPPQTTTASPPPAATEEAAPAAEPSTRAPLHVWPVVGAFAAVTGCVVYLVRRPRRSRRR
ncbi:hypothetical protein [Umezawaea beigongshangensis]|uniref:hypothetical protein n=1 Tax=Umezawaea beigongshangensis TaxID=2780383 RepID=UPI0018F2634E|nr:hypothetical protein [Umezawaea beigongshangensis]